VLDLLWLTVTYGNILSHSILVFALVYVYIPILDMFKKIPIRRRNRWRQLRLAGSCVTDLTRLDRDHNRGRVDPEWKFRDNDWICPTCDAPDKPAAYQIGPLLNFPGLKLPTVKHSCKCVIMAAAIRATSNKVHYNSEWLVKWQKFFRDVIIPRYNQALNEHGTLEISVEGWKKKYSQAYQADVDRCMAELGWNELKHTRYESFPKVELQVTEVETEDRDTALNGVKERQISGPPMMKKILANPVINALEEISHLYIKEYCGKKNWIDLCSFLEERLLSLGNYQCGAADGSGFDMTQFPEMNKMYNELVESMLKHPNVILYEPLSLEACMYMLSDSLTLDVEVGRGAVNYKAEGRASGDGWTTHANTILMASYWEFCFLQAEIPKEDYVLLVKGDDVLFALGQRYQAQLENWISILFAAKQDFVDYGLGQICKFVKFGPIEEMDFLSNHFYWTVNGLQMTRIPCRILQNMPWSTSIPFGSKDFGNFSNELAISKAFSMLAWTGLSLPIWSKLAFKTLELAHANPQMVDRFKRGQTSKEELCTLAEKSLGYNQYSDGGRVTDWRELDQEAYLDYLSERWLISQRDVDEIEYLIDGITSLYEIVDIPQLANFFQ